MTRKLDLPSSPRHLHIYDEDWEWLSAHYGRDTLAKIGASSAARNIIHARVVQLRTLEQAKFDQVQVQATGASTPAPVKET